MKLTKAEQALYGELASNAGDVVTTNDLMAVLDTIRKDGYETGRMNSGNLVAVHIRNLRRKLLEEDGSIERIESVRGIGYKIVIE